MKPVTASSVRRFVRAACTGVAIVALVLVAWCAPTVLLTVLSAWMRG